MFTVVRVKHSIKRNINSYICRESHQWIHSPIGSDSHIKKDSHINRDAHIGRDSNIGRDSHIANGEGFENCVGNEIPGK